VMLSDAELRLQRSMFADVSSSLLSDLKTSWRVELLLSLLELFQSLTAISEVQSIEQFVLSFTPAVTQSFSMSLMSTLPYTVASQFQVTVFIQSMARCLFPSLLSMSLSLLSLDALCDGDNDDDDSLSQDGSLCLSLSLASLPISVGAFARCDVAISLSLMSKMLSQSQVDLQCLAQSLVAGVILSDRDRQWMERREVFFFERARLITMFLSHTLADDLENDRCMLIVIVVKLIGHSSLTLLNNLCF
jgi:hypothetical protein